VQSGDELEVALAMKAGHGGCEASRDGSARKTKKAKKKSPVLAQRRPRREKGLIEEVGSWLLATAMLAIGACKGRGVIAARS
jgi:hypothetical protein